jgi:dsRNA-specific ribonuclease
LQKSIGRMLGDSKEIAEADRILQTRVSNDNLQRLCQDHGIDQFINLNPSQQGHCSPRLKTDTLEAILGAVVEDGGYEALMDVMLRLGMLP